MKFLTVLAVASLSTAALAASNTSINDLQYVPNAGTFWGNTEYAHLKYNSGKDNGLTQKVGLGLVDNLFVDLGLNYSKGDSSGFETKGLADILLEGRYRLSGSSDNRFDLLGAVTISPGKSEIEDDEGNNYSGGHSLVVGAEYGNKTNERQWSVSAAFTHDFESKEEDKDDDETATSDAHEELTFAANLLTRLGENCFFKTFGSVNFEQGYDVDYDTPGTSGEVSSSTLWILGGEFQHLFSKDVYAYAGANAFLAGDSEASTVMKYYVGATYQF